MKERPILFSAPMVRAILEGRKTQTRREIKHQNLHILHGMPWREKEIEVVRNGNIIKLTKAPNGQPFVEQVDCPYGQPGDRLWVRETFYAFGRWETRFSKKKGRDEWCFVDMTTETGNSYHYAADGPPKGYAKNHDGGRGGALPTWHKRPSLFMPRAASRITLEITNIRAERLSQISEADAIVEGVESWTEERLKSKPTHYKIYHNAPGDESTYSSSAAVSFETLWESINGAGSFGEQWVWVVEFKRV